MTWVIQRFRALDGERDEVIAATAGNASLAAAAFDGPLRSGFDEICKYRAAEQLLTRRLGKAIGKPGQASAPRGIDLNAAANACVDAVRRRCKIARAHHPMRINDAAVVEAFPSTFLGLMIEDPSKVPTRRSKRSDDYFLYLTASGQLERLLRRLLPAHRLVERFDDVTNHDDRAALVCAITALAVARGHFTAVGDDDGWIILPPLSFIQAWALRDLVENAGERGYFRDAEGHEIVGSSKPKSARGR